MLTIKLSDEEIEALSLVLGQVNLPISANNLKLMQGLVSVLQKLDRDSPIVEEAKCDGKG